MLIIPTRPLPNQNLQVTLGGQACTIEIFQQAYGLYVNLYVDNVPIIMGVIALNLNRIVRSAYLGFLGDLVFFDTQGTDNPVYTSLGSRFALVYVSEDDLP